MTNKEKQTRELPLIDLLDQKANIDLLSNEKPFELPTYLKDNIKHTLRPYQVNAISNLDWTQKNKEADNKFNHLLFNMATGSGKTDIMSALILYMYAEFGYQNFLFVVNTNAVISKTINNLLDSESDKYLFKSQININNQNIIIKNVNSFPMYPEDGVIYIRLSTIQKLSNELEDPVENGLTYSQLNQIKLVTLADEAHHFSSETKSKKNSDSKTWEKVLDKILNSNTKNRQFEFTATLDLDNDNIYKKYENKIIYRYELSRFIRDGYSKKVLRIQASNTNNEKMLNAILLSQYRKEVAKSLNIEGFKPIVLFKSNKVAESLETSSKFSEMIKKLNGEKLKLFIEGQLKTTQSKALKLAYEYWVEKDDFYKLVSELKRDFEDRNIINVNDTQKDGVLGDPNYSKSLNTLESPSNPFRAIFAVAKLTEGWDVLNLFDIVRIGNPKTSKKQTDSEAQLVGRGARYYPFTYDGHKKYTRRFDNSTLKYSLLETLHYHTSSDSNYINKLNDAFDRMDLPVGDDSEYRTYYAEVKNRFKKTDIYKNGSLYYNEIEEIPYNSFNSLKKYGFDTGSPFEVNMVNGSFESEYNEYVDTNKNTELNFLFKLKNVSKLVKKAMSKNKFYRFNNLYDYIPLISSIDEFILNDEWLGNIEIYARVLHGSIEIDKTKQLKAICKCLDIIQNKIIQNYHRKRGTNRFISVPIKSIVHDYSKHVAKISNKNSTTSIIEPHEMNGRNWFVYDYAIVDRLEADMIDLIGSYIDRLESKYNNVYLLRNDENASGLKLHQFGGNVSHYEGYMPDFILYFDNKDYCYQVYVEPKGDQLIEQDGWKQDLLENIRPNNVDVIGENNKVKLYGLKFYTKGDKLNLRSELEQLFLD